MALFSLNRRFVRLLRKEACYCRLSPADKDGAIRSILYANWRQSVARPEDIEVIDLLDINTPWRDLANLCGFTDHRWANYLGLRSKAIDIEQRTAEEYVSPEQLGVFRDEVFAMSWDFSCEPRQCQIRLSIAEAMPKTAVSTSRSRNEATPRSSSGCACAYFQIAVDVYTDLRLNPDEWE